MHVLKAEKNLRYQKMVMLLYFYFTVVFLFVLILWLEQFFFMLVFNVYLVFNEPKFKMEHLPLIFLWVTIYVFKSIK